MLGFPETIVIFDTEYTCWEGNKERGWSRPGEHKEIVEIGAVLVDTERFQEIDSFDVYVRPAINPILSDYFINLTHITQEDVDTRGIDFKSAVQMFSDWTRAFQLYSFGSDPDVLKENCRLSKILFPFDPERFSDIRRTFKEFGVDAFQYTSGTIVTAFGADIPRRAHNALNDARSIADGLKLLAKKGLSASFGKN